jgi:hypothetical protein
MKIYQLMACGYFAINHARYTVYSKQVYRSQKQARVAMPDFYKDMTMAKKVGDTMVMNKADLRILIHPLELVGNNKGG